MTVSMQFSALLFVTSSVIAVANGNSIGVISNGANDGLPEERTWGCFSWFDADRMTCRLHYYGTVDQTKLDVPCEIECMKLAKWYDGIQGGKCVNPGTFNMYICHCEFKRKSNDGENQISDDIPLSETAEKAQNLLAEREKYNKEQLMSMNDRENCLRTAQEQLNIKESQLNAKEARLNELLKAHEQELDCHKTKTDQLTTGQDQLNADLSELNENKLKHTNDKSLFDKQLSDLETEKTKLAAEREDLDRQKAEHKQEVDAFVAKEGEIKQNLQNAVNENEKLKSQLKTMEEEARNIKNLPKSVAGAVFSWALGASGTAVPPAT